MTGLPLDELDPAALPAHTLIVTAPAKVNPFLRVLGRRADGYHDLETIVLPVELSDRIQIHAYADSTFRTLSLSLEVTGEPGLVARVPVDETNLVLRAARVLADSGTIRGFAEVVLEKRVPVAAGLGGGSGDAAAVLRALNELWGVGHSDDELGALGAGVGSDVPALLMGEPCLASGRGERVHGIEAARLDLVVVGFSFGVSTADVFRWWDEDGAVIGPDPGAALSALSGLARPTIDAPSGRSRDDGATADALAPVLVNDLERSVAARHPAVRQVRERLEAAGLAVVMSGSGPTVVGVLGSDHGASGASHPTREASHPAHDAARAVRRLDPDTERDVEALAGRPVRYTISLGG